MNTKERTLVMISIQGKGVSSGVGVGPLYFYHRTKTEIPRYTVTDPDAEWHRFKGAQTAAIEQLGELAEKARAEAGDEAAMLFETHQMMAEDLDYEEAISDHINNEKMNAEAAISDTAVQFAAMFESMDDSYMQARAADVRDVSDRILGILSGAVQGGIASDVPVLLAADDLAPSETVQLDKSKILGFITAGGSGSSHTAILARTMGIPAIVGVGDALKPEYEGRSCIIDGATGNVVIDPDDMTRDYLLKKREQQLRLQRLLETLKGQPNVTKDGKSIRIYCNIGSPDDVHAVQVNDGGGIGLFRSEFLYLNSPDYPTEDQQFEAYKKVLADMDGKEVIIRTLDIGADKQIGYFNLPKEDNPAMGMRALRICLTRPEIFKTQLRALYRASAFGKLGIMFPMVTSVWEVREAKKYCEEVKRDLKAEGIPFAEDVHAVQVNDGGGIGLFRSEFLYLNTTDYPTEDQQFEAYKQVLSDMDGKEVIIRTLDIGADKQIGYFDLPKEDNPAMGMRALRICLTRPEIFKTQLRALFRASAFGKLGIMFPMVTSVWEVREAKRMCEEVRRELKNEGIPYSEDVQIGIMIETPAAAINSDRLAKEVDFFSIGTNDLTQYTLACDRQNNDLGRFYDPHHPAVLRLIRLVTENAHKNGIWVGICGELGADLTLTETFLAFGVDELSVTPRSVLPLRNAVRMTDTRESSERILSDLDSDYTAR